MWPPEIPLLEAKILASASLENALPSPGSAALLFFFKLDYARVFCECMDRKKQQWLLSSYHENLGITILN